MAKVISQDTFDDVVKENIIEFSMSVDDAKEETIKQFEAQGINLANIIKDLDINAETGVPRLNEVISNLKGYAEQKDIDQQQLLDNLNNLLKDCERSLPHRVLAEKNCASEVLYSLIDRQLNTPTTQQQKENTLILETLLKVVNSLFNKQPDIFNPTGLSLLLRLLLEKSSEEDETIVCLTLQWLQKACIMHERNRQTIMNANIMKYLKGFVNQNNGTILREVLAVFRYLVLDDDIRVEFGCAHEHARQIATEIIVDLTRLLSEFPNDQNVLADLLLTIGALAVRQEFCLSVHENNGIKQIFQIMVSNPNAVRLNREALKLLRSLAGHDTVKNHIVDEGVAPILKHILEANLANENIVSAALACIATLTLRVPANSRKLFEAGLAEIIVESLRLHSSSKTVQRNGAWAIRNMVSRSREQCETWLSYGVEDLLNAAMLEHISIQQDIKAALRDLGCKVLLKEEWTGTAEKKILNAI